MSVHEILKCNVIHNESSFFPICAPMSHGWLLASIVICILCFYDLECFFVIAKFFMRKSFRHISINAAMYKISNFPRTNVRLGSTVSYIDILSHQSFMFIGMCRIFLLELCCGRICLCLLT